jgi:hypothetical protein
MSDFLTRLAQRQLGQIESVEPRLPGLYAPAAAMPLAITEEVVAHKSDTSGIASASLELRNGPNAMDSPGAVARRQDETTLALHSARQFATKSDEASFAHGPDVTFNTEFPVLVAPKLSASWRSIDESSRRKSSTVQHDSLSGRPEDPGSQGFSERGAPPRLIDAGVATPVAAPPRLESAYPVHGALSAPERQPSAAEPAVHVTIGRIEVTAVTAAPAQRRAATTRKPAMSLDDYLARRQRREP